MEELAQVYARALFESAQEGGVLDEIHDQLGIGRTRLARPRTCRRSSSRPASRP